LSVVQDLVLSGFLEANKVRILEQLKDWLRLPSISAHPERAADIRASAEFCARMLSDSGLASVEVLETGTDGDPGSGAPAVYGEWLEAGPSAPTVLVYGHHDVQPVDPVEEWHSAPFEPAVVEGVLWGRGASDDKGQVVMQASAIRGLFAALGRLPVNLKVLIEGEEEVGSPHFEDLLRREKDRLGADVTVVSDTTMLAPGLPSTTVGMRGLVAFDVALRTAASDLHSGIWGGTVPNAAVVAARMASALHDEGGRVTIPGFYDDVSELSPAEAASAASVPFDEEEFRNQAGVKYLEGESGRTAYERTGTRPTAEVVGLHAGYGGPGIKTIVPATANFKIAMRLVPDQAPAKVAARFREWAEKAAPAGAEVAITQHGGVAPLVTPVDHPAVRALSRAIEAVWGKPPLYERSGGSGPEEALSRVLGAPVIFLGVALPIDNFHAPNERLDLDQLWRGVLAAGQLLVELGKPGALR
jgi:acetylornithine deacetylase/succinyl-diaminopimelate desuccinylase-like protein